MKGVHGVFQTTRQRWPIQKEVFRTLQLSSHGEFSELDNHRQLARRSCLAQDPYTIWLEKLILKCVKILEATLMNFGPKCCLLSGGLLSQGRMQRIKFKLKNDTFLGLD